jgi:leader peptidase (prepilin peptidase)/N-methyltransferase
MVWTQYILTIEASTGAVVIPASLWYATWILFGLIVGSFLNAAIHRLPREGMTMSHPKRSVCPTCDATLTWRENVPLLSWLVQKGRCRSCKTPISWRYPLVEVITASLFFATAYVSSPEPSALLFVRCTVLAGIVVATFVDFDFFEIPDEISIGGMFLAPLCAAAVPALHSDTWIARVMTSDEILAGGTVDRVASVIACFAGMAVGGGILIGISWLGKLVYKRDAMGFGDVKLLAAAGGFLGPGGALLALLIASFAASISGLGNVIRFLCLLRKRTRERGNGKPFRKSMAAARIAGRYLPFGPYLGIGIGVVLLAWKNVVERFFSY